MTIVLMVVVAMAIIAGLIWVMMRMERSHRQLIERQREAWRAGGCVGPKPGVRDSRWDGWLSDPRHHY